MTIRIDVRADFDQVAAKLRRRPKIMAKVTTQALNATAKQVQTAAVRDVAKNMGILQRVVRAAVKLIKATFVRQRAIVKGTGRPLNLIFFKPRQTAGGVTASAYGRRRLYPGTFLVQDLRGVYVRESKARLPIRQVWGPGIARSLFDARKRMVEVAVARWPINLRQALNRFRDKL